ncbi:MAG: hypothetical protein WC901_02760 [Candidatus Margulisiibacteriota bacterium]
MPQAVAGLFGDSGAPPDFLDIDSVRQAIRGIKATLNGEPQAGRLSPSDLTTYQMVQLLSLNGVKQFDELELRFAETRDGRRFLYGDLLYGFAKGDITRYPYHLCHNLETNVWPPLSAQQLQQIKFTPPYYNLFRPTIFELT